MKTTARIVAKAATLALLAALIWSGSPTAPTQAAASERTITGWVTAYALEANPAYVTAGLRTRLDRAITQAQEQTETSKAEGLTSAGITAATTAVAEAIKVAEAPLPQEPAEQSTPLPPLRDPQAPLNPRQRQEVLDGLAQAQSDTDERIAALTAAAEAWEKAVADEKANQERIRAEREAAARAGRGGGGGATWLPGETPDQRIDRIAATLPFSFDVRYGTCPIANALGCYTVTRTYAVITDRGLSRSDCRIARVIAHEYRHYQQYLKGQIDLMNPDIAWLEADADAWSRQFGC